MKKWTSLFVIFIWFLGNSQALFEKEIVQKISFLYIYQKPKDTIESYPLIIFLHGAGERGNDITKVRNNGPLKKGNEKWVEKFAILAPQCPEGVYWNTEHLAFFIQEIIKKDPKINPKRIILTGLSMGGWGTFKLAEEHAELFYKIAPICAPIDRMIWFNSYKIKDIPIRMYHGALDDVVPLQQGVDMYHKLLQNKAIVSFFIDEKANNDSWTSVYDSPEIYQWFLE